MASFTSVLPLLSLLAARTSIAACGLLVKCEILSWTSYWRILVGLRGPKSVDLATLKLNAVQWTYILFGLRDGHPDLLEMIRWGPWHGKNKQVRGGTAKKVLLVRIIPNDHGEEIAARVFQAANLLATRDTTDINPRFENPICQTIEKDLLLPAKWRFGLRGYQHGTLFFPGLPARPELWQRLKRPQSIKQLQQTGEDIYEWLSMSVPGIHSTPKFRDALCGHAPELFRVRTLWNFPRTDRPSSDEKRIAFFAESLSGLMLGTAPATATRKLARWSPPQLWLSDLEKTN
jgi:hypothetical protein